MKPCIDNFPKNLIFHSLERHGKHILATAIIVDHVKAMRVWKSCFVHFELQGFIVHKIYELKHVKFDAVTILRKVDTSNFYLNIQISTFYQRFVSSFIKINHCS